jgi:general secretion pathway protein E
VELRLATMPTAFGEKMVLRIFDPEVLLKSYEQLGFSKEDRERWQAITDHPHGIVLVTGPTGSGKTTTLYSTLKQLATPEVNICTIEDPIEMVEPAFNQMQVQTNIELTFASGVRALLRQDPDIIMIGEIRDLETAEMAVQAALTGHLVLSTLHTNDAPSAITRLMELGIPPLPDSCHGAGRDGTAANQNPVPPLQGARAGGRAGLAKPDPTLESHHAQAGLPPGWLPGVPEHRLLWSGRRV